MGKSWNILGKMHINGDLELGKASIHVGFSITMSQVSARTTPFKVNIVTTLTFF